MQIKILVGALLIIIGLFHIIKPYKVSKILNISYKYNPILKDDKQRVARPKFIIVLGIIWVLVGLSVIFLGS